MKRPFLIFFISWLFTCAINAQEAGYSDIDKMIMNGEYGKAADTCRLMLASDSLNADLWYKMGLALQNMVPDTGSFNCFLKAFNNEPGNNFYKFSVAKGYLARNKSYKSRPLLLQLFKADSTNWNYAHYLTGIYIQEGRYDDAIDIYNRFYLIDSLNYVILDKLGFAYLKKNDYLTAIDYYNRSLALNSRNIDAIRNLSFLYPNVNNRDTAIVLLTRAINQEPDDIDLYARRATIYFSKNYTKRALNDYLKILGMGDSSALYLKRAGIGYMYNLQPDVAVPYLLKASERDTSDFETLDFIAQCYYRMNDHKTSAYYYKKLIALLQGFQVPLGMTYLSLAREQKTDSLFKDAIQSYSQAYKILDRPYILTYIANIYDEDLKDISKSIEFYNQFLALFRGKKLSGNSLYSAQYIESIKKRAEYLEKKQAEEKAKKAYIQQSVSK